MILPASASCSLFFLLFSLFFVAVSTTTGCYHSQQNIRGTLYGSTDFANLDDTQSYAQPHAQSDDKSDDKSHEQIHKLMPCFADREKNHFYYEKSYFFYFLGAVGTPSTTLLNDLLQGGAQKNHAAAASDVTYTAFFSPTDVLLTVGTFLVVSPRTYAISGDWLCVEPTRKDEP